MNVMTCAEKTRLFPVKRVCERAMENVRCWLTTGKMLAHYWTNQTVLCLKMMKLNRDRERKRMRDDS